MRIGIRTVGPANYSWHLKVDSKVLLMPDSRVSIAPSLADSVRLENWRLLDDGGKLAIGEVFSERLQTHGWNVSERMTLKRFGPPDDLQSVLQWREPTSGMNFSFIPGGTFRPGFDEAQLARVASLMRLDADGGTKFPESVLLPALSDSLGQKECVSIAPFFLADELVQSVLPGLKSIAELPKTAAEAYGFDFLGDAVDFRWNQVESVLDHFGWSLLSSVEFEWALRGGVSSLFYWGDHFPDFMEDFNVGWREILRADQAGTKAQFDAILSAAFEPLRHLQWPRFNRFGLAAMLPRQTWCAPSTVPDDTTPLTFRGGAANLYPWQGGCFEWMMLLNADESRATAAGRSTGRFAIERLAAIRPMIRLVTTV